MKVIIIGGIAGGASCAARLRRLDGDVEILLIERGPFVSYAKCSLPYHVSGVMEKESSLLLATEQHFKSLFRVDCKTNCEVIGISVKHKSIQIQNLKTDAISVEHYDKLVLAPATESVWPSFTGMDLPGIYSVSRVPDAGSIQEWLHQDLVKTRGLNLYTGYQPLKKPERAVVVGGGFIGLEMVENLVRHGLEVSLIEKLNHLMPQIDPEMAGLAENYLVLQGVKFELNDGVTGFEKSADGSLDVITGSGRRHPADIVILAIGVKPETRLSKMAGVDTGLHGGIKVNEHMCTSNPDIFAIGDSIEVMDFITGQWTLIPLAGEANKQGRIAADVIEGRNSIYRHKHGTSICKIFGAEVGQTGASEKMLSQTGSLDFDKIYIYPGSQTGYCSEDKMMAIKIIFRKSDGRLLGAQVIGEEGVSRRIDSFVLAMQSGSTLYDLEGVELSYSPHYGRAYDAVSPACSIS